MRILTYPVFGLFTAIAACTSPTGPYPSLQPRVAEAIDPRVPVEKPLNDRPVAPALAGALRRLVDEARQGDQDFQPLVQKAERLAASAGAPQSETWVLAQEALSAAVGGRVPVAKAVGDVDEISATALRSHGGIAPRDLAAIQSAAAEIGAIDQHEAVQIRAIQDRLHL